MKFAELPVSHPSSRPAYRCHRWWVACLCGRTVEPQSALWGMGRKRKTMYKTCRKTEHFPVNKWALKCHNYHNIHSTLLDYQVYWMFTRAILFHTTFRIEYYPITVGRFSLASASESDSTDPFHFPTALVRGGLEERQRSDGAVGGTWEGGGLSHAA